jgi:hypothetical protein
MTCRKCRNEFCWMVSASCNELRDSMLI